MFHCNDCICRYCSIALKISPVEWDSTHQESERFVTGEPIASPRRPMDSTSVFMSSNRTHAQIQIIEQFSPHLEDIWRRNEFHRSAWVLSFDELASP